MLEKVACVVPAPCQALCSQFPVHCALARCCGQRNNGWFTVDGACQLIQDQEWQQFMVDLEGWAPHSFTLLLKIWTRFVRASMGLW